MTRRVRCATLTNVNCPISNNAIVKASKKQVSCDLGGEAVILDLNKSLYYGLDPVGARIWNLLQKQTTVTSILDTMVEEYDVNRNRAERDLLALLEELRKKGLIEVQDGNSS